MMPLDYFGVFGWIFGKMDKISKSRNFGFLRHGVEIPHSGVAEREAWTSLGYVAVKVYVAA